MSNRVLEQVAYTSLVTEKTHHHVIQVAAYKHDLTTILFDIFPQKDLSRYLSNMASVRQAMHLLPFTRF